MEKRKYDVAIVGGGASGLAAAVELGMSSPDLSVLVIEKMKEPGRKIRATGSGRCNITNTAAEGYQRIMEFFTRIGLVTRTYDNGLVYPYSESASDVADLLIERAASLGVDICCDESVTSIKQSDCVTEKEKCGFRIESVYKDGSGEHIITTEADFVILAAGGKAGPSYGTTGDGYRLAKEMGHSVITPVPVLTGIECAEWDNRSGISAISLAGTRTAAVVSLYRHGNEDPAYDGPFFNGDYINCAPVFREQGEVQFTKYGLSGICIFNMTRHMRLDRNKGESMEDFHIRLNLLPGASLAAYIKDRQESEFKDAPVRTILRTLLKQPVADYVLELFADSGRGRDCLNKMKISELSGDDIRLLSETVHGMEFTPGNLRGWKDAQATSGGVSLDEIDVNTSESKQLPGLYITGELMDRDYPCGGFNLSNAWLSGIAAADDIATKS